jgi:hypothetical protein
VAGKPNDKQPRCAGDRCGGDDDEHGGNAVSTARTMRRPSATAKPI